MFHLHRIIRRFVLLLLVVTSGCASWHTAEEKQLSRALPAPRRHPDGAMLEVAFVSIQPPKPVVGEGRSLRDRTEETETPTGQGVRSLRDRTEEREAPTGGAVGDIGRTEETDTPTGGAVGDIEVGDTAVGDTGEANEIDFATLVALEDFEPAADPADQPSTSTDRTAGDLAAVRAREDIWQWIDETVVAPEVRQALRRNGLRLGKVQGAADFNERLNRIRRNPGPTTSVLEIAEVESDLSHQARLITCRTGKRYELPVRQPSAGEQAVLVTLGGKTIGQTLSQPQPLFALRATAADVNLIRLSLRPEIQHGAARQTWVGSDAALRIDNRRASWTFEELAAEVPLEKGGILVAGCTYPAFGLGQQMFTGTTADGDDDQVLMVIRVADLPELIDR